MDSAPTVWRRMLRAEAVVPVCTVGPDCRRGPVFNPLKASAWTGLMIALGVSAGAREVSSPPSELGPWPDPIEVELREGGETLALPEVDADARARQEVLPALLEPQPPVMAGGGFELTVEPQVPQAPMLPTVEEPAAALPPQELPPAPAQGAPSDSADATVSASEVLEDPAETALRLAYDWPGQIDAGPPEIEPVGDPDSLDFVGPLEIAAFGLLGEEVAPGTRARLYWNASQTYAGGDLRTPVDIVHGDRKGPVLCLTAAVHGDELNGVEVVRRVMKQLPPSPLAGTVIGVPVVNLFGFSRNSRYLPDRRDLNRFFPGSPTGSIASRIAYGFFDQVARHCDALVDMHTGSFDRINLPQVRADLRIPHVLEFTRGFGATPVLHSAGSRGMLRVAATQAGIPAVTFEVGGPGELEPREIEVGVQSLLTLVHKLGMVRDSPEWLEPQATFYESRWVRANRGGMLISDVALGERVQRGQRIGLIVDPLENSETDIVASVSGRVIGMALNQVVLPGYAIFHLGEETSETGAVNQAATGQAVLPYEEDAGRPPTNGEAPVDPLEEPAEEDPRPEDFE
jgi:predicted deacylase